MTNTQQQTYTYDGGPGTLGDWKAYDRAVAEHNRRGTYLLAEVQGANDAITAEDEAQRFPDQTPEARRARSWDHLVEKIAAWEAARPPYEHEPTD